MGADRLKTIVSAWVSEWGRPPDYTRGDPMQESYYPYFLSLHVSTVSNSQTIKLRLKVPVFPGDISATALTEDSFRAGRS